MDTDKIAAKRKAISALFPFILVSACLAQTATMGPVVSNTPSAESTDTRYTRLEKEMQDVLSALSETRDQLKDSHQQIEDLRHELGILGAQLPVKGTQGSVNPSQTASDMQDAVTQLRESDEILQSQLKQHDQTKVESASKYPVKISGLILFSSLLSNGSVDDVNLPTFATPKPTYASPGSLTATPRQSILGVDAKGPHVWGGTTSGDVRVDFFGGVPTAGYDASSGTVRLRTAHAKIEWPRTSVVASFDTPLISPLHGSSYLSVAQPPLAWSGNLWVWAPQLAVTRCFNSCKTGAQLEFGLIDPAAPRPSGSFAPGLPRPGEASRQPGYESRFQYAIGSNDWPIVIGAGAYYDRQRYSNSDHVDAWAGTLDWTIPAGRRIEISGEAYRGRGIGGLGGGAFKDYYIEGTSGLIHGFDAIGGWTQIKARLTGSLEANTAIGQDNGYAGELRNPNPVLSNDVYSTLTRNRTIFGNVIFRPRAYLVLSMEYRNIRSWQVTGPSNHANSFGLETGYSF
jgi:gas vesicle protein